MAGQKLSILRLAAMSLLETLQENDFVNIVVMVSNLKWNQTYMMQIKYWHAIVTKLRPR